MSLMMHPIDLFPYQQKAIEFQSTRAESALWLDMGLGKTAITLTSIAWLLSIGALRGVLIVAPIRVCRLVWRQEAMKWSHTRHLRFSMVVGDRDQRIRALTSKAVQEQFDQPRPFAAETVAQVHLAHRADRHAGQQRLS